MDSRIVISARPFVPTNGGYLVLHKLCDSLLKEGLNAWMKPEYHKGEWCVNPKYRSQVSDFFDRDRDVAFYHDGINGNPWGAKYVIRWMTYQPRYELDGYVLYLSEQFGDGPYLRVIEPNLDIFYDRGLSRRGICWAWRKARKQGWTRDQKPREGVEIRKGMGYEELAHIFNTTERFVAYDGATFLSAMAALCGCDSIIPRPVSGKFLWPGVAYSEEKQEVRRARKEHGLLREVLEAEYREQDRRAAEVIRLAFLTFGLL